VNRWNPFPEGYTDNIQLAYMGYQNGQDRYVDARIADDLQAMFAAMRADGVYPVINGAYRSHAHQTSIYQSRIAQYQSYGYSYSKAVELAQKEVAIPGTSEHELGLALDIISNYDTSAVYNWLAKYSWKYGFIHRYPSDKTAITGISNEPWHYRYVGKEAAKEIYQSGLTLEEYIAQK
jgi:D-alanyl-D-alanine carboxypeptidase